MGKIKHLSRHSSNKTKVVFSRLSDKLNTKSIQVQIVAPQSTISKRSGYVRVCAKFIADDIGIGEKLTITVAKKKTPGSVCLFMAGGKEVDDKVARANAAIK